MRYTTTCPFCGYRHDSVSVMNEKKFAMPKDGDVTICIECGHLSIFDLDNDGGLRKPTRKELGKLVRDARVRNMLEAWFMMRRKQLQ